MSTTICMTPGVELDVCVDHATENIYVTEPMVAIHPLFQHTDEEVLHLSFDDAITKRLISVYGHWRVLSDILACAPRPLLTTEPLQPLTTELPGSPSTTRRSLLRFRRWQLSLLYSCCALICLMSGFDLMGVLVLHMH